MPAPCYYPEQGRTPLAEELLSHHRLEIVCRAGYVPKNVLSAGFNLDSAGKKSSSDLPRRAFTCRVGGKRLTVSGFLDLAFKRLPRSSVATAARPVWARY
jgi:hypothetical protein